MKDKDAFDLEQGDYVLVTPGENNLAKEPFNGIIQSIRWDSYDNEIATVLDENDNPFECESPELEKME